MTHRRDLPVVVVGGGFGGLEATKALGRAGIPVILVDRHNYHLFQPLTYQVATGGLAAGDIAVPLRHIVRAYASVEVLLGEVTGFDLDARQVILDPAHGAPAARLDYRALIVAGGSDYAYFGHEEWRAVALEVKSLDSALEVRGRILAAFEAAELAPEEAQSWLTFVVVGGGPTGVEIAGQIAELAHSTLRGEFRHIDPTSARVVLVEMADRVLSGFAAPLPERAARALEGLGVSLMLDHTVVGVHADGVDVRGRDGDSVKLPARTVVWAAGVTASPLARLLADAAAVEVDRSGRLTVEADLSLAGHPEVLALGDMVRVRDPHTGEPRTLPGLAPAAMQEGRYAAAQLVARDRGRAHGRPFHYRDKGSLATIGRAKAVAEVAGVRFSGFPAWVAWLVVHIFYLIGFENRLVVMLRWAYSYFTRARGNRLITRAAGDGGAAQPPQRP
jgi:NADH:ubiquinone reductase (H+-translocating)